MTTDDAKSYLAKRQIPHLFESLMTGLMYHRPGDHISYLIDCLQKVQEKGQDNITWSSFVDIRRNKTPLPPIDKRSSRSRPNSCTRTPKEEPSPREVTATEPLPSIPKAVEKVDLPDDVHVVVVMGAPGSDKSLHVEKLLKRYPSWEHVNMSSLIKKEMSERGDNHTKWRMVRDYYSKGEAVPEDVVVEVLVERLKQCTGAKGIIISGFPRSMVQVADYDRVVGRLDCVFMLDCDEQIALDKLLRKGKETGNPEDSLASVAARLNYFKSHTLPAAKGYDDQGKLIVIDGDQGEEKVVHDLGTAFDNMFFSKYGTQALDTQEPPKAAGPPPPAPTYKGKYESEDEQEGEETPLFTGPVPEPPVIDVLDEGRKPDLPQCPIVFVAGGPGSGKGTQCQKIAERYPDFVHLSMGDILREEISTKGTADEKWDMISQLLSKGEMAPEEDTVNLLKENLKKHSSAKAFLVEGFPRNKEQVEAFNKCIGGLNLVLLFDCEEEYMRNRLIKRGKESGRIDDNVSAIARKLHYYKHYTLPVLKYYDDLEKLVVRTMSEVDADKDKDETFYDVSGLFDYAFFQQVSGEKSPALPEDEKLAADAVRVRAAVTIQANYRGYMVRSGKWDSLRGRHITDDDKQSSDTEIDPVTQQAATRIQAGYRGYKARSEVKARQEEAQKVDEAASRLQAGFYGYKVRSEMQDRMNEDKREQSPERKDTEAASRIQAGYHGYKARSEYKVRRETQQETKKPSPEPAQEEVVEATITPQAGTTTGDDIANPAHTEKLDEIAKQEESSS